MPLRPMRRPTGARSVLFAISALVCVCTFLASPSAAQSNPQPAVSAAPLRIPTLSEAIDIALGNGPEMFVAMEQVEQGQIGALAARSALSWQLDAGGSHGRKTTDVGDRTTSAASLTLRRTFAFDPTVRHQLQKADLGAERTRLLAEQTAYRTVLSVFEAYRGAELALVRRKAVAESVHVAQMSWEVAASRSQTETIAQEDAEKARLDLLDAELEHETSRRMLELARLALAQQLGIREIPSVEALPIPSLEELRNAILQRSPAYWPERVVPWELDLGDLRVRATENRPEVRLAEARVRQAQIDVALAALSRRPVFFAEAGYTRPGDAEGTASLNSRGGFEATLTAMEVTPESTALKQALEGQSASWEVRIGASVDLWDSAGAALEARRASSALDQAESEWEQAKAAVELDISHRYVNVTAAHDRLRLQSERTLLAIDRLGAEQRRLELGLATPLSVAVRELDVHLAVVQTFAARVEYEKSVLELAASAGMSIDELRALIEALPS